MTRFIAFIRGINVGGRVVKKETLVEAFRKLGFRDVETFRQSGNVIFESDEPSEDVVRDGLEAGLKKALGYEVFVFVRKLGDLKRLVESDPFKGVKEGDFLVTFLPPTTKFAPELPLTIPKSTAKVIAAKGSEVFSATHGGGEGALPNRFIESKLKVKTTTRNMNVIRDVVEKFGR